MTHIDIRPDAENPLWTDLIDRQTPQGHLTRIGLLRGGMASGAASVAMAIRLADGTTIFAETSWVMLQAAVRTLAAGPVGREEVTPL